MTPDASQAQIDFANAAGLQLPESGDEAAVLVLGEPGTVERGPQSYGAVFTRRWVVDLILDLAGYIDDQPLWGKVAVEPACGDGAFLIPMVERLSRSCRKAGVAISCASDAVVATDLQRTHVQTAQEAVAASLVGDGWPLDDAIGLSRTWIREQDFLLGPRSPKADFVLGNPPYVRLEALPNALSDAYRAACPTMTGRADLYVGFVETALYSLKPGGVLGFICADRWMRNQYGKDLRRLVGSAFAVEVVLSMHDVDAFHEEVSAYPAITVIRRSHQEGAVVAEAGGSFGQKAADVFRTWVGVDATSIRHPTFSAARLDGWFDGTSSWPMGAPERLALVRQLEADFPPLQDAATGTRVGIGVATGADAVFVTSNKDLVEADRLLPLAMAGDTATGHLEWSGSYLVDPWDGDSGRLVELTSYPRLKEYFEASSAELLGRNVAERRPLQWYRTIDRVDHSLTSREKLVFPDIKDVLGPVLDRGATYPHHNLYFVVTSEWDIEVLGGLLLSDVAQMFIECYAVRMRGGYLRFQAQYLRRIRVPELGSVDDDAKRRLAQAFEERDRAAASEVARVLYGLEGN